MICFPKNVNPTGEMVFSKDELTSSAPKIRAPDKGAFIFGKADWESKPSVKKTVRWNVFSPYRRRYNQIKLFQNRSSQKRSTVYNFT